MNNIVKIKLSSSKYHIVFTDDDSIFVGMSALGTVRDENGSSIGSAKITEPALSFYVLNTSFVDSTGNHPMMDMVIHDVNDNDSIDIFEDKGKKNK